MLALCYGHKVSFHITWEQRKLIDIAKTFIGLVTTMTENYRDSGTLLIRNSDIKEGQFLFSENPIHLDEEFAEKNKTRRLQIGDVVTVHTGDIGTSAVIEEKEAGAIGFATINTRTDKSILNPYFLATYFNTEKHKCYANSVSTGDGRSNYNIKDFNKLVISVPTLDEQERISVLINDINIIITLHQRKLDNLKLKKKALLQKLFPKNGERYPELRFPEFTDAWEQRKLSDISTKVTTKNVDIDYTETLTNSAEQGIISQVDFFDKEITNKDNINGYYIVENNDFIYNPRISTLAPVGPINRNKLNRTGIMSPLYTVFRASNVDLDFLEWYFQSSHWHRYMKLNGDSGARADRIAIKDSTFFDMPIKTPVNIKEQVLIGETLEKFNQYITLHQRKLDHLQLQKKALLQQMFV